MWFLPLKPDSRTEYNNHISDSLSLEKGTYILIQFDSGIGCGWDGGGMLTPSPLKQKFGKGKASKVLEPKNTLTDVFDNTLDISDFRAHIFCLQTTQGPPKKHNEAGPSEPPEPSTAYCCNVTNRLRTH